MKYKNEDFVFYEYGTHAVLHKYLGSDETAVIPAFSPKGKPVTELGSNAFSFNRTIQVVIIPESCTTIGCGCFDGAYQLRYVNSILPGNTDATHSVFPKSVRRIEYRAFSGTALVSAEFQTDDELEICEYAFSDCYNLKTVSMPNCKSLILGDGAYMRSGITSFSAKFASSCVSSYAFAYCSSLVDFCTSYFNRLEDHAFYCCRSLERIAPRGCVSYDRSVFDGCTSLKTRMCTLPSHIV